MDPRRDVGPDAATGASTGAEPSAAAATTGSALISSGLWSTAARVIPQLYTLVILVVAARYLGPERLGRQSYIAFIELSVIMLATGGMPMAVMRYVGESIGRGRSGAVSGLIRWAWGLELVAGSLGGGAMIAAGLAGADPAGAWTLAGIAAALGVMHTVPSALLIGAQRWRAASIVGLVTGSVGTAATVAVLAAGGGITEMFAVEAAIGVVNLAWTTFLARRTTAELVTRPEPAGELRKKTFRYALAASVGVVLSYVVWRRSEFFFLERYSTFTEIAIYSIPFSFVTALVRVFEAVTAVLPPAVATLHGAGAHERIRSGYGRAVRLVLLSSIPLTAAMLPLGPAILGLLGQEYKGTGIVTVIMLATFPLAALARVANGLLHGLALVRPVLMAGAFAAAANILLDFLIIPGNGAVGAAIANGGAQIAAALPALYYSIKATGSIDWQPRFVVRCMIVSTVVGAATWSALAALGGGIVPVLVGSLVAAVSFALAARVCRFVPPEDAAWLHRVLGTRLRGIPARLLAAWSPKVDEAGLAAGRTS